MGWPSHCTGHTAASSTTLSGTEDAQQSRRLPPHQEQVVERRQGGADDQRARVLQRADQRLEHAGALGDDAPRRHRGGRRRRLLPGAQPRLQALWTWSTKVMVRIGSGSAVAANWPMVASLGGTDPNLLR